MPYIAIKTSLELSEEKMEKVKTEIGRLITILANKTEAVTMVDFCDCRTFYKAGVKIEGAMIELRLWGKSEFEEKKNFTEELFKLLTTELGLKPENMSLNVLEFNDWGSGGTLKSRT